MFDAREDARIRAAAFAWLGHQVAQQGDDVLPRTLLAQGFLLDGVRVPLLGPQGIFKPRIMQVPLSITTAPQGPYDDAFTPSGLLQYRYRGTNRDHPDNRGLRFAKEQRLPLAYLHGITPGKYLAAWPVYIVGDNPRALTFTVALDDARHVSAGMVEVSNPEAEGRRAYITAQVRVRLHQRRFRERVLAAYRRQCAFCRLRHEELLDAAHIIPDADPGGEPVVSNGLALCTLHHKAFDRYFIGVRPDFTIEVREDLRSERDGPTLLHAIQGLHDKRIVLPQRGEHRPSRESLEVRYGRFREAVREVLTAQDLL